MTSGADARNLEGASGQLAAATATDRDGDRVADSLERRLQKLRPAEDISVIVTIANPATRSRVDGIAAARGFAVTRRVSLVHSFAARVTRPQVQALATDPEVRRIEANSVVQALADGPQESFGVAKARLDAGVDGNADGDAAGYSKDDLVAAVIDTGIDTRHADLDDGKVIAFANCSGQPCAPSAPSDDNGHGTYVSNIVAGSGDARPDRLYQGVAPGAGLIGVKVLDRNALGTKADMIAGLDWVVANKGAYGIEVVNLSIGIPVDGPNGEGCSDGTDAFSTAVDRAVDAGLVVVVAAGNSGPKTCSIGAPAAAAKALTVGAMADLGVDGFKLGRFSGRGPTADGRTKPDVVAPGVQITSAQAGTTAAYTTQDGTSAASPFVAGLALLMLDATPGLTPAQVKGDVMATAVDWDRAGDNTTAGSRGADVDYGAGRLDAYAAIRAAGAAINTPPTVPPHDLREGTLAATGSQVDYPISLTDTRFPIAGTLLVPQPPAGGNVALSLLDASGAEVARSTTDGGREAELGFRPTVVGAYKLRVASVSGSAQYFVDISANANRPPVAVAAADVTRGPVPLTVNFDGSGSSDPDAGDSLSYAWDLDGDGSFDDGAGARVSYTYTQPGSSSARLQVTDSSGAAATAQIMITAENQTPAPNGLIAAYGFDEGSGASVADASGKTNAGTISGATWTTAGKFGTALTFDGINDWVTVPDANSLDLTGAMTLEAWVKPSALGSNGRTVLLKEQPGGLIYALYAHTSTQGPSVHAWIGGSEPRAASSTSIAAGSWTHLAGTYDGSALKLYVHGTFALSQTAAGPITPSSGVLRVGGNAVWSEWFSGAIDEVRLYDRALSASEIQADMTTPLGSPPPHPAPDTTAPSAPTGVAANTADGVVTLSWSASIDNVGVTRYNVHRSQTAGFTPSAANRVAQPSGTSHTDSGLPAGTYYYRVTAEDAAGNVSASSSEVTAVVPSTPPPPPPPPAGGLVAGYGFEQGSGSTVADSSGNNNAGTISGAGWTTSGKFGSALSFDGVNDWVTVNDANSLDLTGALTLSAWVKPTTNGSSWQTIVLKEQPGELTYALYSATSTGPPSGHVHIGNGEQNAQGPTNLPAATWTNLALTYDGSRLRLYRDGNEIASQTTTGNITTSNGALRIGGNNVWAESFHGLIDEVRLYNRALTPSEIQTDMTRPVVP